MGHIDSRVIKQIWKTTALKRKLSVETRVLVVEDRVASTCRLSKDLGNFWYRCLPKHFWNSGAPVRRRYSMMSGFVDELPCNNFFLQYSLYFFSFKFSEKLLVHCNVSEPLHLCTSDKSWECEALEQHLQWRNWSEV